MNAAPARNIFFLALLLCGSAAATEESEQALGYDDDAAAMIAAIEARQAARADDTLHLPALRVEGKRRYNDATGTKLIGESAPEGGVIFVDVDENWRAKHQW